MIYDHDIVDAIHRHGSHTADSRFLKLRIGADEYAFGRYVSVRYAVEYQYGRGNGGDINFIVYWIDTHAVVSKIGRAVDLRMRPLDDPDRRDLPAGIPFECQHGLSQRTRDYDLIVHPIIGEPMHGPAD